MPSDPVPTPAQDNEPEHQLILRQLTLDDAAAVAKISGQLYKGINSAWTIAQFERLHRTFPEGQIGVEDNGELAAFAFSLIVDYSKFGDRHTYSQITGKGQFTTHDADGDTLYGIEVCVSPELQGMRVGRRLYDARKELCEQLNLRAIVAGGRMPGYKEHQDTLTPRQYIDKVRLRELSDPVLSFQLSNDFHVKRILTDYLPSDTESKAFATLIEWINIYFTEKDKSLVGAARTEVRLGIVQLKMRTTTSLQAAYDHIEFFIDAVSGYKADFIVFPEYVNAPLMAPYNHMSVPDSIRELASLTEEVLQFFITKALEYNINIITGSMPLYENGSLYNAVYLCRRDGTWERQLKIHITPSEESDWGMVGGDEVKVFDTDSGRIAMLICYDIEFPELGRILADKGVQILFVPFCTDTSTGYYRVRLCAQARAVENECYVAIAGSVGNLPKVVNMDIQYAQSAVFSPSDFAFPDSGVITQATTNTEMTLIADVDLDDLKHLHNAGSVRNLRQRRHDLYEVRSKKGL